MSESQDTPVAQVVPRRVWRWVWLIPIAAALIVIGLGVYYVMKIGPSITVTFSEGAGIKPGDLLRCRGIVVGSVTDVALINDSTGVAVTLRLDPEAQRIARAGSQFWVERPRLSVSGIAGLETIAGPRYMVVIPGEGAEQDRFVGLDEPPAIEVMDPNGLEIILLADRRGSLRPGAPLLYRGSQIGAVIAVGLASDAASVEVRSYIRPEFTALVRDNSRFWNVSGAEFNLGLTGLSIEVESLAAMVEGGIAMATPDHPGQPVATGHRFNLSQKAEDEWTHWRPALPVGAELLPVGTPRPQMLRATRSVKSTGFFGSSDQTRGWVLPTAGGLLGPADLLKPADSATLEVAGQQYALAADKVTVLGELAMAAVNVTDASAWPAQRMRRMNEAEDCIIVTDAAVRLIPLSASRFRRDGERWTIDPIVSFDPWLHGAAILSRKDGALVGLLMIDKRLGSVALLPNVK